MSDETDEYDIFRPGVVPPERFPLPGGEAIPMAGGPLASHGSAGPGGTSGHVAGPGEVINPLAGPRPTPMAARILADPATKLAIKIQWPLVYAFIMKILPILVPIIIALLAKQARADIAAGKLGVGAALDTLGIDGTGGEDPEAVTQAVAQMAGKAAGLRVAGGLPASHGLSASHGNTSTPGTDLQ
jgi:hypothetical protein